MGVLPQCSTCSCSGPGCGLANTPEYQIAAARQTLAAHGCVATPATQRAAARQVMERAAEAMRSAAHDPERDAHDVRRIAEAAMKDLIHLLP